MKRVPQPGQLEISFFNIPATPRSDAGALDVALTVRDTLTEILRAAQAHGIDRYVVAAQMSRLSSREWLGGRS